MRKLLLLCAGLTLASGIVAVKFWRDLQVERERIAALQTQLSVAEMRAARAEAQALPAQPTQIAPRPDALGQTPQVAAIPPAIDDRLRVARAQMQQQEQERQRLMQDPEYRKVMLAQMTVEMQKSNPDLAAALGLTPDEAGQLFALLARIQLDKQNASLRSSGTGASDPAAIQEVMRARQEVDRQGKELLAAQLGADRYQQYQQFEAERPSRLRVEALARTFDSIGQTLSDAQTRPLIAAIHEEDERQRELVQSTLSLNRSGNPDDQARIEDSYLQIQTDSNRRIVEAARQFLTPKQVETLKSELEQPLATRRVAARIRHEQGQ